MLLLPFDLYWYNGAIQLNLREWQIGHLPLELAYGANLARDVLRNKKIHAMAGGCQSHPANRGFSVDSAVIYDSDGPPWDL